MNLLKPSGSLLNYTGACGTQTSMAKLKRLDLKFELNHTEGKADFQFQSNQMTCLIK